ncbi:flagellin [Parasulfitobacter algicola]|uniref:Flagellin n=1 Tax=Parasulfitobacter algicola TaxID=2614809 RepID=A0ABX2IUI2_9RHOB|nr:flagellin [Sulfitobacter algicola]NSX56562.1 flagellin [Sulfitobacter algicola]
MSSILTNNGAMTALQTLKSINNDLSKTQAIISTGKEVASAKDNAAVWAISKVMESDVKGFQAISESLSLGESTVSVAREASEQITDLLTDMKTQIVASQGQNVDRTKLQTEIEAYTAQIESIAGAAQFNGLNLLTSGDDVEILSSLDRSGSNAPTASTITVERQNLSLTSTGGTAATFGGTAVTDTTIISNGGGNAGTAATVAAAGTQVVAIESVADGNSYRITLNDTAAGGNDTLGERSFEYVANADDSAASVAAELTNQIANFFSVTGESNYSVTRDGDEITLTNNGAGTVSLNAESATGGTAGVSAGGLGDLNDIDVTTDEGAAAALASLESMIDRSIDAAASFGSVQSRIETQASFVSTLTDSLKSGIGSLVDADMEEASARLQALQVQQQLGVQSLSIANQAPQSILSLFR